MSNYNRQIDIPEPDSNSGGALVEVTTIGQEIHEKLNFRDRLRAYTIMLSITFSIISLGIGLFFLSRFLRDAPVSQIANTATATYIEPIILRTFCTGGSWAAYIGVIYDTKTTSYGVLTYYPTVRCDNSLSVLQNILQSEYPINSTTTVWFYPDSLPFTYTSDPYIPLASNPFFIWIMVMTALFGQMFIVVPINVILTRWFGFKRIGPIICCSPVSRWIG